MRTITQRTTLPFLIAESGAASFTAAVTTSPRPARTPRSPPRGKMHESLRAPLLSATSRIVLIPIMAVFLFYLCPKTNLKKTATRCFLPLLHRSGSVNPALYLHIEVGRLRRANQRRAPHYFF